MAAGAARVRPIESRVSTGTDARIESVAIDSGATATDVAPLAPGHVESEAPLRSPSTRLAPLAVASALFIEFVDSTALSTALPTLSRAFQADPVHLKLALTSYLVALAVFVPASGWLSDRFGAKRVFLSAMAVFLLGSALCGFAGSLPQLVGARVIQGLGGAMMTPVGRQILLGTVPRERLVSAMAWFTTPALVGPLVGPPIAGFILGVADWRWIFFVNLPIGLLGMAAVVAFAPRIVAERPGRFDTKGFLLTCTGITAAVVLAETAGAGLVPVALQALLGAVALVSLGAYGRHARRALRPILDLRLFSIATYRASLIGGAIVRLGLGATPFLLPLLLQVGLGFSPARAGLIAISTGLGAIACKPIAARLLRRYGFRRMLVASVVATAALTTVPAVYGPWTPVWFMAVTLFVGGFVRSLQFTCTNSIAYADVDKREVSQASTLATVAQQVGMSFGVSFGALLLHLTRGSDGALTPDRFVVPFVAIGAVTLLAVPLYARLDPRAGASLSGRGPSGG